MATLTVLPTVYVSTAPTCRQTLRGGLMNGLNKYARTGTLTTAPASPLSATLIRLRKRRRLTTSSRSDGLTLAPISDLPQPADDADQHSQDSRHFERD